MDGRRVPTVLWLIFASFPIYDAANGHDPVMLDLAPLFSESSFTASYHYDFIIWVLALYGKSLENVVALIADNLSTNKALADICERLLLGCASSIQFSCKYLSTAIRRSNFKSEYLDGQTLTTKVIWETGKIYGFQGMQIIAINCDSKN